MSRTPTTRLRSRPFSRRSGAATALVAAALTASTLTVSPAAVSAPVADCPDAYPVDEITATLATDESLPVTGLTVVKGTTPTGFTGSVLGVIDGGIAPGLDMIVARLTSPEIDRVGGIWQGMSGSPVYAEDGRLIGAVAYGLSFGPSTVAGITPYAEMKRLLNAPNTPARARTLERVAGADEVDIPRSLARSLASEGVVPRAQADGGLARLPLPLGVSGLGSGKRLDRFAKALDLSGVRVHAAGAVTGAAVPPPIEAGGNLAASISYGDVSAVGVGTATAVCGDQVLAFGHPMIFSGPSQLAMHNASAVYVQEDPVSAPFKVANASAPLGAVLQDRMAGLLTLQDASAIPETSDVTSFVEVPAEGASREGKTHINVPDAVPDIAAFHLLADQDRVFDGISGGSATVGWTVTGTRADGRTFALRRNDVFANRSDISFEPVFDLFDQLATLHFNEIEEIGLGTVTTRSSMSRRYAAYAISRVQIRDRGRWRNVATDRPLVVRSGQVKRFRVTLTSQQLRKRVETVRVVMPKRTGRKFGYIEIVGGNSVFPDMGGEEFSEGAFGGGTLGAGTTFDQLLRGLRRAPTNDLVMANLHLFRNNGTEIRRTSRKATGAVVNGMVLVEVMGIG